MSERPKILEQWDEVQHDPLTVPPDDFEGMSIEDGVERIKEWFLVNFEDPVHSTPHISAGGDGGGNFFAIRDCERSLFNRLRR